MKKTVWTLALLMLLLPCAALAQPLENTGGYALMAQNERFSLYLDYERGETLQFYVQDAQSDVLYRSSPENWASSSDRKKRLQTGSQLVVTSIDKINKATYTANSQASSVAEGGATVTPLPDGFRVTYAFPRAKDLYTIPVEYRLEEDGLRVDVKMREIVEEGDVYVQSVAVLPNFFAADAGQSGYLLVPDGCGALIDFSGYRKGMTGYRQTLYGRDPSLTVVQQGARTMRAGMPVLGIQNGNAGVLMIAEQGSALAAACAYPAGSDTVYSAAYFEFTCRAVDKMMLADKTWYATDVQMIYARPNACENASVLYRFCADEESGYVGMAGLYREYLTAHGLEKRASDAPLMNADVYCGVKKERSVLGVPVTDLVAMTAFADASRMLSELSSAGVSGLRATLLGWNKGGLQDVVQSFFSPDDRLGGARGLDALMTGARQIGVPVRCDVDLLRFYQTDISHNALFGAARAVTGEAAAQYVYYVSTYQKNETIKPWYLLSPAQIEDTASSFARAYPYGALSASSMGELLYSDFTYDGYVSRQTALAIIQSALDTLRNDVDSLAVSYGNAYSLAYADAVMNFPLCDSGFDILITTVPFASLVLHGSADLFSEPVNLSQDRRILLLQLLEAGVNPCFALTNEPSSMLVDTRYEHLLSTQYAIQKDDVLVLWDEWSRAMDGLNGLTITDHAVIGDLRVTTYEDGTRVYVNYGASAREEDGVSVEARGYAVVKGGR